jgi:hypothetical protein
MTLGTLGLATLLATVPVPVSVSVPVRFVEGTVHGFLVLEDSAGALLAQGDLLQVVRGGVVESRMVFRFSDGSSYDETVTFTQDRVFVLQSYHQVLHGPAYTADLEIWVERTGGKYRVTTKSHKDGREKTIEGRLDLPADVYNGMAITVAKNLAEGERATVHYIAFTPEPRMIQLAFRPAGSVAARLGPVSEHAVHYVLEPRLGTWVTLFATLLGRMPPDEHIWIVTDDVPAFGRFQGPLYVGGPVWRIELTSPRWSP